MIAHDSGTGTPLVLIHGFGVDHHIWEPLLPVIEAAGGWRIIRLDLAWAPGAIDRSASSATDVLAEITHDIDTLLGNEPFAVAGNSFGGMMARAIAHEYRDRVLGLATIAGVFVAAHADRDVPQHVVIVDEPGAVELAGDGGYEETAVVRTSENALAWRTHIAPALLGADQTVMGRISAEYDLPWFIESGRPFTAPTLILTGRQDSGVGYVDAWDDLEHYPRATYAVLDAAGHNVHFDAPDLAAAHVTDWLRRIRMQSP